MLDFMLENEMFVSLSKSEVEADGYPTFHLKGHTGKRDISIKLTPIISWADIYNYREMILRVLKQQNKVKE